MSSLTLTLGGTTVELPDDLFWTDEYLWQATEQSVTRTITGAQIIQSAARLSGRHVTLQAPDDAHAWITRSALETLRGWATTPANVFTLAGLRGVSRQVVFRHADTAITANPVQHFSDAAAGDFYVATLRFMEV